MNVLHELQARLRRALEGLVPDPAPYATQAARLVLEDPKDDVAFDALQWLTRYQADPAVKAALAKIRPAQGRGEAKRLDVYPALVEHHADNPKMATVVRGMKYASHSDTSEAFLEAVLAKATDPKVRGFAGDALAGMLARKAEEARTKLLGAADFLAEARTLALTPVESTIARQGPGPASLAPVDPLETAALMVIVGHLLPFDALASVTTHARRAVGAPPVAVEPGAPADLVAVPAANARDAIANQPCGRIVIRRGELVSPSCPVRRQNGDGAPGGPRPGVAAASRA